MWTSSIPSCSPSINPHEKYVLYKQKRNAFEEQEQQWHAICKEQRRSVGPTSFKLRGQVSSMEKSHTKMKYINVNF